MYVLWYGTMISVSAGVLGDSGGRTDQWLHLAINVAEEQAVSLLVEEERRYLHHTQSHISNGLLTFELSYLSSGPPTRCYDVVVGCEVSPRTL
jgi:hypothetical protein